MAEPAEVKQTEDVPYTEEMRQLLLRAQAGDETVLPELRSLLDDRPELWRQFGDLAGHARDSLLGLAAGKSLLARESIRRRMDELQAELAGPAPTPLEKLLVERIVLCWAQSYLADLDGLHKDRVGSPQGTHALRRQSAAQTRYLSAIRQLALVRKLLRPTTLELLRFPVDETSGDVSPRHARNGAAKPTGGMSNRRNTVETMPPSTSVPTNNLAREEIRS